MQNDVFNGIMGEVRVIKSSILFDEKWYKKKYNIRKQDAAIHYLLEGYTWDCQVKCVN